jgi:hypothetical protein
MTLPDNTLHGGSHHTGSTSETPLHTLQVAVVDDNTWYREGLGRAGGLGANHEVVARATNVNELVGMLGSPELRTW